MKFIIMHEEDFEFLTHTSQRTTSEDISDHEYQETFRLPLSFEEIKAKTEKYILNTYQRFPVAFYYGQGAYVYDSNNKQYIDFLSGISVTNLGHAESSILQAIEEQSNRIIHSSNLFYSEEQALLAEVLVENSFPGKVFFCNSGTEANEAAIKFARLYGQKQKNGAEILVSLERSFHGRTFGALSITGNEKVRKGLGSLLPNVKIIPPNIEILERVFEEHQDDICGIFLEPIQGEAGIYPLSKNFLQRARELTKETKSLLIFDEIQCGIGRTGHLFAFQYYDIEPDVITLAKGLGNGFPIGAMIVKEEFADVFVPGIHGSTFGGNHLACRVAFETIKIFLTTDILDNVRGLSEYFFKRLYILKSQFDFIKEIRGVGLMFGIELNRPCRDVVMKCLENGLIVNCTAENVIRILPPLNIDLELANEGLNLLQKSLESFR
ncbi:MAG: aspartate aminotransferase family protein [Leptospiraceae bacterium]|nr:aspartate aminotransferase family protein [Leptospiraceae bacterium]MDW7976079.1 aspartate aminotransferase family protein [Leptospiraceae bacterium]